ncbi:unnamed protein product [Amoebophrya sp. A120]|nr:unnamed protein product [Amoebophrya sp. A120]|eukprot:GSA120T00005500001.1
MSTAKIMNVPIAHVLTGNSPSRGSRECSRGCAEQDVSAKFAMKKEEKVVHNRRTTRRHQQGRKRAAGCRNSTRPRLFAGTAKRVTVAKVLSSVLFEGTKSNTFVLAEETQLQQALQTPRERYLGKKLTLSGQGTESYRLLEEQVTDFDKIHFLPFETVHDQPTSAWLQTSDTMHEEREHEYLHNVKHWDRLSDHHDDLLKNGPPAHESASLIEFSKKGGGEAPKLDKSSSEKSATVVAASTTNKKETETARKNDDEKTTTATKTGETVITDASPPQKAQEQDDKTSFLEVTEEKPSNAEKTTENLSTTASSSGSPEQSSEISEDDLDFDVAPENLGASTLVGYSDGASTSQEYPMEVGVAAQTFLETATPNKIAETRAAQQQETTSLTGAAATSVAEEEKVEKTESEKKDDELRGESHIELESTVTYAEQDPAARSMLETTIPKSSEVADEKPKTSENGSVAAEENKTPVEQEKKSLEDASTSQIPASSAIETTAATAVEGEQTEKKSDAAPASENKEQDENKSTPASSAIQVDEGKKRNGNLRGSSKSSALLQEKEREQTETTRTMLGNIPALLGAAVKGVPNMINGIINPTISNGPQLIGTQTPDEKKSDQLVPNQLKSVGVKSPFHQLFGDDVTETSTSTIAPPVDQENQKPLVDWDTLSDEQKSEMKRLNQVVIPENEKVVPLSDLRDHTSQHLGTIFVGANKQPASVIFDTGSTNLWVLSELCQSTTCKTADEPMYSIEKSGSNAHYFDNHARLEIMFGSGTLSGPQAIDSVLVARHQIQRQPFAMIEEERGGVFDTLRYGGIMGLAFESMAAQGMVGVMTQAMRENVFSGHNQMSFYFTRNPKIRSGAYFGGANPALYHGTPQCLDVVHEHYWQTGIHRIGIMWGKDAEPEWIDNSAMGLESEEAVGKPLSAIWDTGTTWNAVPTYLNNYFMQKLQEKGFANVDCSLVKKHYVGSNPDGELPWLVIDFAVFHERTLPNKGGKPYQPDGVSAEENYFRVIQTPDQWFVGGGVAGTACKPGLMSIDVPSPYGPNLFIIGEIFMRHFLVTYDRGSGPGEARVCLAPVNERPKLEDAPELDSPNVLNLVYSTKGTEAAAASSSSSAELAKTKNNAVAAAPAAASATEGGSATTVITK